MTICNECKKEEATINFSNSTMDTIHGFTEMICKNCYMKRNLRMARDCVDTVLRYMEKK